MEFAVPLCRGHHREVFCNSDIDVVPVSSDSSQCEVAMDRASAARSALRRGAARPGSSPAGEW